MHLPFTKMQGAGNDFVVLDATRAPFALSPEQIRRIGDRRFGIGCDQLLVIEPASGLDHDFRYRIFNGGSGDEVEHCGNGARCFVRFCLEQKLSDKTVLRVRTMNRLLTLQAMPDGRVRVDMDPPEFAPERVPYVDTGAPELAGVSVLSMGNPHAVLFVDDVDAAPVEALGQRIQALSAFPQGVNVGFLQVLDRGHARIRVYERGAGETLACGTGACAAVVAGIRAGLLDGAVEVQARGGMLRIEWDADTPGASVFMTGPAETVFTGEITL
ncbi:diaminopimelate epimerase [Inhella sp.]|uniref:diaminopimelate epimerase n=1 Tax=Inhella sp. TaxID=1921806 RepID=UPI0035AFB1C6